MIWCTWFCRNYALSLSANNGVTDELFNAKEKVLVKTLWVSTIVWVTLNKQFESSCIVLDKILDILMCIINNFCRKLCNYFCKTTSTLYIRISRTDGLRKSINNSNITKDCSSIRCKIIVRQRMANFTLPFIITAVATKWKELIKIAAPGFLHEKHLFLKICVIAMQFWFVLFINCLNYDI